MKKNLAAHFVLFLLVFLAVGVAPSVRATTATWTNTAGGNAWETAGNWDINQVPTNNTFDVNISIAAPCNLSGDFQIGALNLSISSATLNLKPGSRLPIASAAGLNNNGTIVVNTTGANTSTNLRFDIDCPITGTGSILLNGFGSNFGVTNFDITTHTVTIGAGQTLHGHGSVLSDNGVLINNGTINGDDAGGGNMQLDFTYNSGVLHKNNGTIKATNGGVLGLYSGTLDQTGGGTMRADGAGSILQIGGSNNGAHIGATLIGGTLNTSNGGVIQIIGGNNALFTGVTNNGAIQIPAGQILYVNGTGLTNNGTILVNTTAASNGAKILFTQDGTLGGTGSATLNGPLNSFNVADLDCGGQSVVNAANHTMTGNGDILVNGGTFTNNGTIAPGITIGQINVYGSLVLGSTSKLSFDIGGTTPATQYDVLQEGNNVAVALNGTLAVRLANSFVPAASDIFTIFTTPAALTGAFSNVASGQRLNNADGSGSFIVTYSGNNVVLSSFQTPVQPTPTATPTATATATPTATATATPTATATATPTSTPVPTPTPTPTAGPSQLLNVSTRLRVQTGENVLIGGFIITGTDPKKVIVRAIGPSLAQFFSGALADTTLELHSGNGTLLASNDNWKTRPDGSSQQAEIEATGIPPSNDLESAIVITLPANNAGYTAIVRGKNDITGIGVVEAYDLNQAANSRFGNIATRGFVDTGDNVMIGGLIIGGGGGNGKVVVRAIGPTLGNFGIAGALQDPTLELHDGNGNLLLFNNNWQDDPSAGEVQAINLAPNDPRESAVLRSLPPGAYTAIVRGNGNTTGVGLVEVYNVP